MTISIKRVLVADIESANRLSIKNIIQSIDPNVDVLEVSDGKQALDVIKALPPELIIAKRELSISTAYEISRFITHLIAKREYIVERRIVSEYDQGSLIIYSDKEVFEYDLYWAFKGSLSTYTIVSIQHGFSGLEENIKRFFDGGRPNHLYSKYLE